MMIDYFWSEKETKLQPVVKNHQSNTRYQLYNTFMIIKDDRNQQQYQQFDENFRKTINQAYKDWDQNLPSYVD